ncbi:C-type lectin domain and C-type lectin-like domain and C-type lectin fold domain-containing protein [Strongyloides ratti]|uniref:C-type lectin domain and C-type lectin-like domain and C-type lectin fold domain-containing protein n=1 Tax=Strongyloides ratti TaxID=34506 RepID=A0A090MMU5_STRRB|nr:C-type lectin domain and C-type lectin-like domain and C-type lectin fold domain-containing protein [Strongyloides ratti]CEF59351.1 C-type lectin domain and C-type lectin-like domain and C-type lectin fold domain-containing protein [Strongyloides ratti]
MITSKIIIFLFYLYVQLNAFPKFQPISSVNLRPTTTWIPGPNDNKYQFHNGWQTWLSAREYCLSQNSDLVSINSDEELNWILKHYPNDITGVEERHVQIGLFIPASENNNWTWTDKSIVNYTLSPFNNMNFLNNDKKCGVYLINKKTFESVSCDIPINPTDKPIRFICERSNENHMALEKANNPLWEKFDKILQFLGISDVSSTGENLKKKEEKKKDDYYDDDNEFDSREFDKIKKKDTKDKTIIVTIVDSQDSNNTKISKEIKEEINNEGSGDEVTNDFDSIATRKNIALSTPIMKTTKSVISEISDMVETMKNIIKVGLDDNVTPVSSDDYSDEYNIYSRLKKNRDKSLGLVKNSPPLIHNVISQKTHPIIDRAINLVKTFDSYGSDYNDSKDNKIDIPIDDGNMKLVQMQKIDGVLDNRIIGDNLISKTPKLSTIDDFKYHDIEGSGEDIIKVNNQKNDGALSLNSINSDQGKHAIIKNNKIEGGNITNNISSTGHIDEVTPINNVEIENVEKKIVKFFKVLYQYLKKTDVKSLKEIIDSREPGVSIMDHLKNSLNAANQREVDQIKALEKLYQMGVNLEKVRHDSINKTLEHNAVKTAIKDIEKELTDELTKNMSEEFDEANNLVNNQSNYLENPNIKKIIIYKNETTTQKENLITTRKIIVSTKNSLSKNSSTATKSSLLNKKRKKVKKNKKINKNKNKKNNAKKMPKIIDEWHPEIPPTEEQKKEFLALEKGRAKLNDDTYEIFRNFNENERTKKLLNRIHQHEMEKKKSSEKELLTKSIKNKSQETSQNDFNGLLNLVTKTDKTVNNFIDKHK